MKANKTCQSCGMPLKRDPKSGGTNADGTVNHAYCSYCYAEGQFTQPDMTVDQMRTLVIGKLKEMGFPRFISRLFAGNLNKLERWRGGNA